MSVVLQDKKRKGVLAFFVILLCGSIPAFAQQGKLTLAPAKADQAARQLVLAIKASELVNADAVPMYHKTVKVVPANIPSDKMKQWREMPASQLPLAEAQAVLEQYAATFMMLEQAVCCSECKWPKWTPEGAMPDNLVEYRTIAYGLALRARVSIAGRDYEDAIDTIRAGLRMAQQVGESDTMIQQLVAVSIAGLMCREIEQLVQSPESPSLYWAFQTLPMPLVDLEKSISAELSNIDKNYNESLGDTMLQQLKTSHAKVRLIAQRLSRHFAALQCVEVLRLYAGENKKLPMKLADVATSPVPNDPTLNKPFIYRVTGSSAVLETPIPEGGVEKDAIHYELTLMK